MKQNKVRIYFWYAFGEIVLVMIGILLALQVNNWNEARLDQIKEKEYLNRLLENLEVDQTNLELRLIFFRQVKAYGDLATSHYEGYPDPTVDNGGILLAYFQASQIWPLTLNYDTYEELKSAGELDLIQNVEIRSFLSGYYGEQYINYELTLGVVPPYRETIRGRLPYFIQNQIWENCHSTDGGVVQELISCAQPEGIKDTEVDKAIQEIENEDNIADLRYWLSNIFVGLEILENQKRIGLQVIEMIEQEVNN